jgi:hypothetical protein
MSTHAYREALSRVLLLTPDEQLQLLAEVATTLRDNVTARPKHNIMEFRGFAKELWQGVDVEKYIDEERNSWDR